MSDYFNITSSGQSSRLWILFPGLLGQSSDLLPLLPESDQRMQFDYPDQFNGNYNDYIKVLHDQIREKWTHNLEVIGLGYSMGGRLLYSLIQHDPDLIQKAVFISSGLPLSQPKERYLITKRNRK